MQEIEEEEEVLGTPSFEVLVVDGDPIVGGSYFMAPPLYMRKAEWDPAEPGRLTVFASDDTIWYATDVPRQGRVNVVLVPVEPHPSMAR
ncbi:hypothetical protein [Actinomadura madurae]|uniref:hypothetical protein n=1 Tax=Actinomadura madurae TaxID=1993 RepID=UPI002025C1D4|nr:hypothetical protein [Actinomadura madurae]MCP9948242.1 hypothetical protein [Actinomadura madurae]MCP9965009.1 hypothetical protein [Actinomadura madurae]MCP9977505.1 hypothetical protein [Actinomadura madurae]MCQ0010996.1 hypothetical protein [Actinomadura madurae]MCQ0013688.1 hypothetical protein [Actinomadura madurae]